MSVRTIPTAVVVCGVIGLLVSQYRPVIGVLASFPHEPWSEARQTMILSHVLLFSIVGGVLAGMLLAFMKYMTK
jgi:hypothetical protein